MEDDASIFLDGKTLANLRVVDLKLELEKRGLSKSGSKKDLVKRLKQQLEFEKLCGERKSTGDCDLKLELDADTEKNEFVQQYLAQQQKIYAQQKEVKRQVELEEIQKSGDEKESCDSTKGDDDKTEDESEPEPKDQKADKVPNDSAVSSPLDRLTKDENEDVFEVTDAVRPSSVKQDKHSTEKKNQNAEDNEKDCEAVVQDECSTEALKPKAEVRDIEKDREKELSTAISSLLSVEKSEKRVNDQEDLTTAADSVAVDGAVTRTTHDDDREKDLATAVLSSLLGDQDVEAKGVGVMPDTCGEVDGTPAQLECNVAVECVETETSSGVDETSDKSRLDAVTDSVEVNVESTIDAKDGGQSGDAGGQSVEASLEVVQKPPAESSEITEAVQEEVNLKMDVSSVPYSLSEIQLPESPVNIVKPQTKSQSGNESSKTTESDEDVHSNSAGSKSNNKVKRSESGDLNGKDTKSSKEGKNSEDLVETNLKKESENEKGHRVKASEVGNTKRSKVDRSDSDTSSGDEKSRKDKGHKKKYDSSDENRSLVKKSSDSLRLKVERRKVRKNRSSSSEEGGRSRDRSRTPKKSSRRDRNHRRSGSSEKDQRSRTKNKRGSPKKSSREGRRKRDKRHRSGSSEDDRSMTKDRSPKKASKVGRRERSVGSEEERPSGTQSRESPKKDVKSGRKEKSVSSGDERPSRTQNKESPKRETKVTHGQRSVSPEEEKASNLGIKESQKSEAVVSKKERSQSSEKEQRSPSRSKESPKKESRTSHKEPSPRKETRGSEGEQDSGTSSSESSPKKPSDISEKLEIKDSKRKYSDDESKREESPVKKTKTIPTSDLLKTEDTQEKMDCQSPGDEPSRRKNSSPRPTKSSRQDKRRSSSSRSRSPEKVSISEESVSRSNKRPPSPKEPCNESSPENDDSKTSPERVSKDVPKDDVSDGELASSRESSPAVSKWEGVSARKPSTECNVTKQSTITVIKKEAPKQRLKIKRDNVIVVKKDKEDECLPDESRSTTEGSVVETPEPIENEKLEPGEFTEVPQSTTYVSRKITLSNRKQIEKVSEEPVSKRSKWGSFAASRKAKQTVSISTDSLKNWFPDFKLLKEPVAELTPEDPPSPVKDASEVEIIPVEKDVEEPTISAITKRLERPPMEEEPKIAAPLDTPVDDGAEPTRILFVRNLVRPFTLLQLKEMLGETGKMVDGEFWIDKIKSKCFVTYETEEEAVKTRSVLNGARWPMSNPKILAVDFATEDDLAFHRSGAVDRPKPLLPSSPPRPSRLSKERERRSSERDGRRERVPVREWDKDKMTQDSPVKIERRREEDRTKAIDKDKKEGIKRRPNEDTPAKLLDDLFQKTKTTPCIYWLPLTEEQVKERAEQLRQERLDQEQRRNQEREQENKRPRSKQRMREPDTRRSSSRSRSPVTRRR